MYSRVTLLELDTVRLDVDQALERYRREILPQLQRQPGYEGCFVLVSPEGQGLVMSLWSGEEEMAASTGIATEALETFATIFRAPPGRERYQVRLADVPALTVG
jgi:hypothetical protein